MTKPKKGHQKRAPVFNLKTGLRSTSSPSSSFLSALTDPPQYKGGSLAQPRMTKDVNCMHVGQYNIICTM